MHNNKKKVIDAYNYLYENDQLSVIYKILSNLQNTSPFVINGNKKSNLYPNIGNKIEVVLKQYLYSELITKDFNDQLLRSLVFSKNITHPLPKKWRKVLIQNSVKVNNFISCVNFIYFSCKLFIQNIYKVFSVYKHKIYKNKCDYFPVDYIELCDISEHALPKSDYNIFNWLILNYNINNYFDKIFHNSKAEEFNYNGIKIISSKYFINKKSKINLLFWIMKSFFNALFEFLKGNLCHLIIFYEAFLNKIISEIPTVNLANEYLFSISNFIYRPMWTYTAQSYGCQVTLYGYASSFGGFKTKNTNEILEHEYNHTTWPKILFWTDDYIKFIKSRVSPDIIVEKVGVPIYMTDNGLRLPQFPKRSITIFDVSPIDEYHICRSLSNLNYRNTDTAKFFLLDLYKISRIFDYAIIWKRKRQFGSIHSKEYIQFCNDFEKNDNILTLDPEISAFRVILNSNIVISMPFTSTSFIANYFEKKTFFYDPTKVLYKDDRGSQGIPLLSGFEELLNYFKILKNE